MVKAKKKSNIRRYVKPSIIGKVLRIYSYSKTQGNTVDVDLLLAET